MIFNLFLTCLKSENEERVLNCLKLFNPEPLDSDGKFFEENGGITKIFACSFEENITEEMLRDKYIMDFSTIKQALKNAEINYLSLLIQEQREDQNISWEANEFNNVSEESIEQINNLLNPNGKMQCRKN
jgi:hypothetical protein